MPRNATRRWLPLCLLLAAAACGPVPPLQVVPEDEKVRAGGTVELRARAPMRGDRPAFPVTWEADVGVIEPLEDPLRALYTAPPTAGVATITVTLHAPDPHVLEVTLEVVAAAEPGPAPEPEPDPQPVTVVAVGDIACDPQSPYFEDGRGRDGVCLQGRTADLAASLAPDAVVALGDLQYSDGSYSEFMGAWRLSWGRFDEVLYPALGSHEYYTAGAAGYFRYLRERGVMDRLPETADDPERGYYAVDLGPHWRLVVLNSECEEVAGGCAAGSPQHEWFVDELGAAADRCVLVAMHDPRFNTGRNGADDSLGDLFAAAYELGADLMLTGHEHRYERFAPLDPDGERDDERGVPLIIVGTGGKSLYATREDPHPASEVRYMDAYGVLHLTLDEGRADFAFRAAEGFEAADAGTVLCR